MIDTKVLNSGIAIANTNPQDTSNQHDDLSNIITFIIVIIIAIVIVIVVIESDYYHPWLINGLQ